MMSDAAKVARLSDPKAFEYIPNYFKHRFKNRTEIVVGAISETELMEALLKLYMSVKKFIERAFNIDVKLDWIPFETVVAFNCSTNMSKEGNLLDLVLVPVDGLTLYGCHDAFPTSIFSSSETVIVTAEPTLNVVPTLNLLQMETVVTVLFALSSFVIALLLTVSIRLSQSRPSRSFLTDVSRNFWDTLSTFFYEPYPNVSSVFSARVACATWLVGMLVICIQLSSYLKSEFSVKTYNTVSSLKELADHDDIKPYVTKNGVEFRYIKSLKNQHSYAMKLYNEINNNGRFYDLLNDMISDDFYFELANTVDKKALIIHRFYLNRVVGFDLQNIKEKDCPDSDGKPCSLGELPLVHVGVDDEKRDTMTILISKHFYEMPILRELVNLAILVFFETKCVDFYDFENAYNLEFVAWKAPVESYKAQKLSDMTGIFSLFFYMSMFSILVFLSEIVFANLQLRCRKAPKKERRRNRVDYCRRIRKNSFFFEY